MSKNDDALAFINLFQQLEKLRAENEAQAALLRQAKETIDQMLDRQKPWDNTQPAVTIRIWNPTQTSALIGEHLEART